MIGQPKNPNPTAPIKVPISGDARPPVGQIVPIPPSAPTGSVVVDSPRRSVPNSKTLR